MPSLPPAAWAACRHARSGQLIEVDETGRSSTGTIITRLVRTATQRAAARTAEELRERRASRQLCLLAAERTNARPLSLRGPRRHFSPVTVPLWVQAQSGLRPSSIEGRTMAKLKFIAVILTAPMAGIAAYAQDNGGCVAPELSRPTPGHLLDQDYLTSTGETVPRPGVPQSSGETALDRKIREQNDRIDNSICTGC